MNSIDAQQELAFIKKVIADSRTAISGDGKDLIVWGLVVVIGMVTSYVAIQFDYTISKLLLWAALIGIGWTYTLVNEFQNRKKNRFKTFGGKILGSLWMGCGIVMTLVGFLTTTTGALKSWGIIPMISLVLGIGYLVTGVVHDNRWTRLSALGWWGGAIIMFIWPGQYMFLLFSAMMIAFQIVPGMKLYQQWKSQHASE
jgi:hypothetical protein